jgi:hypothetical protein
MTPSPLLLKKLLINTFLLSSVIAAPEAKKNAPTSTPSPTPSVSSTTQPLINLTLYANGAALATKLLSFPLKIGIQKFFYENTPKTINLPTVFAAFDEPDASASILSHSLLEENQKLSFEVNSTKEQTKSLTLQYLLSDISWNVYYTAQISSDQKHLNLNGSIEILNKSGTSFPNAKIMFDGGSKPTTQENNQQQTPETEQHFKWSFPRNIELPDSKKQYVSYIAAHSIPLDQEYRIYLGSDQLQDLKGTPQNLPIERVLEFKNSESNGLGVPFASGKVTIYQLNQQGAAELLPTSTLKEAAIGSAIPLHIPSKLDFKSVSCLLEQTDFKKLNAVSFEAGYRLQITNKTEQNYTIKIVMQTPNVEHTVTRSSHEYKEDSPNQLTWLIEVPSSQPLELRFRLKIEGSVS